LRRQKLQLALAPVLSATAAAVSYPLIARSYDAESLAEVGLVLMLHALFGVLDLLKPVLIREIVRDERFATLGNLFVPSVLSGVAFSGIVYAVIAAHLQHVFSGRDALMLTMSAALFILYTPLWATLDAHGRVGTGFLVRSASTAVLYLMLALVPGLRQATSPAVLLVIVNASTFVAYMVLAQPHLHTGATRLGRRFVRSAMNVLAQNAAKAVVDFLDRLYVSVTFPAALIGAYSVTYDVAAKVNLPAQLVAAYMYPELCRGRAEVSRFALVGAAISGLVSAGAVAVYLFGEPLFAAYFGQGFHGRLWLLVCLLVVSSTYTQSFFGQVVLRANGRDVGLSVAFIASAVAGALLVVMLAPRIGLAGVLFGAITMKSSSLAMQIWLVDLIDRRIQAFAMLVTLLNYGILAYVMSAEGVL